jgi:hypothetical protein
VHEVIARAPRAPRSAWVGLTVNVVLCALWAWRFARDGDGEAAVLLVLAVVATACLTVGVLNRPQATVTITDDALLIARLRGVQRIERSAVRAVHGDVPGRPSWSEYAVVETEAGAVRLAGLDVGVPALVERLQQWAGVGEQPAPR